LLAAIIDHLAARSHTARACRNGSRSGIKIAASIRVTRCERGPPVSVTGSASLIERSASAALSLAVMCADQRNAGGPSRTYWPASAQPQCARPGRNSASPLLQFRFGEGLGRPRTGGYVSPPGTLGNPPPGPLGRRDAFFATPDATPPSTSAP